MATLTDNISADEERFVVSGDVSAAVTKVGYRIDDEIVLLRAFGQTDPWSPRYGTDRTRWVVARGAEGTTPATHLAGATIVAVEEAVTSSTTLVPPEPFAGEGGAGGGVTVDNQSDPPAEVTTIVAPGAEVAGDTATLGPATSILVVATGATAAEVSIDAQAEDGASVIELDAYSENGPGTVQVTANSDTGTGTITLTTGVVAINLSTAGDYLWLQAPNMGFFDANPVPKPEVPATPTEQDIVDALVLLGLVSQAAP